MSQSSLLVKIKARLIRNPLTRLYLNLTRHRDETFVVDLPFTKWHYHALIATFGLGVSAAYI